MAENKTQRTDADVGAFIAAIDGDERRRDSKALVDMMSEITGEPPAMWGPSIVGFGRYHYRYASGREGDAPAAGFSPRKANLVVYLDDVTKYETELARLGPHKTGSRCCVYLKRLADVDLDVLRDLITSSYEHEMSRDVA